jgi:muconolactone delta-isomerase
MESYMIDIELPEILDEDFFKQIPHQKDYIKRMMKKGSISTYSFSSVIGKLWVIVHAESLMEVKQIVHSFPIFNYMRFKIYPLLFHETNDAVIPHLWLN